MKLLGVTDGKYVVASMGHYDYISHNDLMADGGQPGTAQYAGYNRLRGQRVWFTVPQTFAELYYDYNFGGHKRKYGVWKVEDVRILSEEEYPDIESIEYIVENAIWGTGGPNGDQRLKYVALTECDHNHLVKILEYRGRVNDTLDLALRHLIENNA